MPARTPLLAIVWLALLAVVGCGHEETLEIREWTLHRVGEAEVAPLRVSIPAHLEGQLPAQRTTYALRSEVTLPPSMQGRPLTLAIPFLEAPTRLVVDGTAMTSLDSNVLLGQPSCSSQSFRIDAGHARAGPIALELLIDRTGTRGAWLDTVPHISATPAGDRQFLLVRTLDHTVVIACFAVVSTIGFTYLALYFFDRRRRENLFFALQGMATAYYLLERLQIPQGIFGLDHLAAWFFVAAMVSSVHFNHAYFGLPPPSRWFLVLLALQGIPTVIFSGPFQGKLAVAFVVPLLPVFLAYQIRLLLREWRRGRDRFGAGMMLMAFAVLVLVYPPDAIYFVGRGHVLGGALTAVLGPGIYSVVQALMLGRDHARTLRTADALNVELASRVSMLEARDRENSLLNEELRRQIADKSRRLSEALARIGAVPERVLSLSPGDIVQGRYRLIRRLGEGGMGAVHEIERLTDGRRLALKVLTGASTGSALARLAREAQVAAEVSHENLVGIIDVDVSESGALYLVMELVLGAPLYESAARYGDIPWARGVLLQIAKGLSALHARGVVHRDLKPANVLLTPSGTAKIADFGIARLDGSESVDPLGATAEGAPADEALAPTIDARAPSSASLTQTGVLMGTPLYMAPELAKGARLAGPAADVWSFGVIAFELLTARFPFDTPPVLTALAGKPLVSPTLDDAEFDPELVAIIRRCLDPDARARPRAEELAQRLAP